jgi:NTE family protein
MVGVIRNLVFQGGGVKGIAYAGALAALERRGAMASLRGVAGASAGAFTAMLVAVGCDAATIARIATGTDYPALEDHFDPLRLATSYGLYRGDALHAWIAGAFATTGLAAATTFAGLQAARGVDLRVFATDLSLRDARKFSARATPDVAVVDAVRASMSIPLMFPAWRFPADRPDDHLYVDGGVVMNFPIDAFDVGDTIDPATVGFRLVHGGASPRPPLEGFGHPLVYARALYESLLAAQVVDLDHAPAERSRCVDIDDFGISATDFHLPPAEQQRLYDAGFAATESFLDARPGVATGAAA